MNFSEIQSLIKKIFDDTFHQRLGNALSSLEKIKDEVNNAEVNQNYQNIAETYHQMLKYSFEMAPDPQRQKIFTNLQQSILSLSEQIKDLWIKDKNLFGRDKLVREVAHAESRIFNQTDEVIGILNRAYVQEDPTTGKTDVSSFLEEQVKAVNSLFIYFLLKNHYSESEVQFLGTIYESNEIEDWIKAMFASAVSLSNIRHFDRKKILYLFNHINHPSDDVAQRMLIGLFINLLLHAKRLTLYSDIQGRVEAMADDEDLQERLLAILLQFIRARDTEKVTRKIQEEIVPEVLKMRSELEDKLKLEDLLSKESFDDKNPEWENFFKDSPDVYQKLEQFSKMQTEGADVFMGAFAMLKHFPFFKELPNWFLPFEGSNPVVSNAFGNVSDGLDVHEFIEGLQQSTVMCNSDKYSFCLNITHMPEQQRKMMLDLFSMEMKAMNEAMSDEVKLNNKAKHKIINTQYIQDLYRFFKLFPDRKEFPDIFKLEADILKNPLLSRIFTSDKTRRSLAEFYFATDAYEEAIPLYEALNQKNASFELFEKMGFCYQKLGKYEQAITQYKRAELFDKNKLWLQKKLGYCYRKTGEFQTAIEFYKQINQAEPNDLNNLAYLGQLHIDIEDFEEALKFYYKVEYEKPDSIKVFRPIGWCSFVLGKYDTAIKYFRKVIDAKPGKSDFLNIGHSYWAAGDIGNALEAYRESVKHAGGDVSWFRNTFQQDSKYLKKTGIEDLDVMLMIDYILMS